jgi:hypothetical protein
MFQQRAEKLFCVQETNLVLMRHLPQLGICERKRKNGDNNENAKEKESVSKKGGIYCKIRS